MAALDTAAVCGTPAALRAQKDDTENSGRADVTLVLSDNKYYLLVLGISIWMNITIN